MSRKPESQFASGSDELKPYHRLSTKSEAVKFMHNECRRWLAGKATDHDIDEAVKTWEQALTEAEESRPVVEEEEEPAS